MKKLTHGLAWQRGKELQDPLARDSRSSDALEPECRERNRKSNTEKREERTREPERRERRWLSQATTRRRPVELEPPSSRFTRLTRALHRPANPRSRVGPNHCYRPNQPWSTANLFLFCLTVQDSWVPSISLTMRLTCGPTEP